MAAKMIFPIKFSNRRSLERPVVQPPIRPAAWVNRRFACGSAATRYRLRPPRGLTLLEIIMVLAVMVAVAAMSLPALYGPMEDQRLSKTAELIRAQWTKARVKAIKTGQIQVFRYTLAGDTYVIQPWSGEVDALEAAAGIQPTSSPGIPLDSSRLDVPTLPLGVNGSRLPDGMFFYAGQTTVDARAADIADQGTQGASPSDSANTIVFYPDGTTSDAKLTLTNERCFIEIKIRGLTGAIRVSDLLTAEELTNSGGMAN